MTEPLFRRRRARPASAQSSSQQYKISLCAFVSWAALFLATTRIAPTTHAFNPPISVIHGSAATASSSSRSVTPRSTPGRGGVYAVARQNKNNPSLFHNRNGRWEMYGSTLQKRELGAFGSRPHGQRGMGRGGGGGEGGGGYRDFVGSFVGVVDCLGGRGSGRGRQAAPQKMSMAEGEGGGAEGNGAVMSAVAVAGFAALLYGLQHSQGGPSLSLESLVDIAKGGPSAAGTALQSFLTSMFTKVEDMGSLGPLYFGAIYVLAEVFIIPALPFTAAAGYLFGVTGGTAVVLTSATIAAGFSFLLGRTFLRGRVEALLEDNPKFVAIDKAIGKEGFKIILLLRLSPIFPFALSNYFYGVTAVSFVDYITGTMLGFLPGTLAYVYGGTVGKAITDGGEGMSLPWYGYAAGAVCVGFLLKAVGDIAINAVEEIEPGLKDDK